MKRLLVVVMAFGLLRCWCWFTFLEGTAAEVVSSSFAMPLETLAAIFATGVSLAILPSVYIITRRGMRLPVIFSCLFLVWLAALPFIPHSQPVDALAAVSAAAGFACFTMICTNAFLYFDLRTAGIGQCLIACVSVVFLAPYLFMGAKTGALYVFLFLPLAAAILLLSQPWHNVPPRTEPPPLERSQKIDIARYVGLSILINLCCGTMHGLVLSANTEAYKQFYAFSNFAYLAGSALLGVMLHRFRRMRYKTICLIAIPLMAIGFVLFPLLGARSPLACFLFLQTGFSFFNVFEWICILSIAMLFKTRDRPWILGFCILLWTGATSLGLALPESALNAMGAASTEYPAMLAAIAGVCLSLAWLLTPGDFVRNRKSMLETRRSVNDPETPPNLTRQERVVLDLLAKGLKNAEVCQSLNIAESTLRTHLKSIYRKTGIDTRRGLIEALRGTAEGE